MRQSPCLHRYECNICMLTDMTEVSYGEVGFHCAMHRWVKVVLVVDQLPYFQLLLPGRRFPVKSEPCSCHLGVAGHVHDGGTVVKGVASVTLQLKLQSGFFSSTQVVLFHDAAVMDLETGGARVTGCWSWYTLVDLRVTHVILATVLDKVVHRMVAKQIERFFSLTLS